MSQQHRVPVFGSSFVARLANSPYYHMQIPQIGVEYYGVGGLQLEQVSERPEWKQMKLSRPSIVVLHCGGNSIRRGTSCSSTFQRGDVSSSRAALEPPRCSRRDPTQREVEATAAPESRRVRCHAERTERDALPKTRSQFRQTSTVHHQMS